MNNDAMANSLLGDLLALGSAAMFSLASVMLRKLAPAEFDIGFFMGVNGFLVLSVSPVVLVLVHVLGIEKFQAPGMWTLVFLAGNALLGCTLANYLYTSALLVLSPLAATVSMSLSIPVSALMDQVVLRNHTFSTGWAAGAALVGASVFLVALDSDPDEDLKAARDDRRGAEETELQSLITAADSAEDDERPSLELLW